MRKTESTTCPYCSKLVSYQWDNGVVSSPDYVLIADWVYHTQCWDRQVAEHPSDGGGKGRSGDVEA